MAYIEWTEDLSVHVKKIDDQHKKFIELINRAHEIDFAQDKELGDEILDGLIEFVRIHFETEENYFKQCHYGGAEEHIAEHMKYTEKVLEFKDKYQTDECDCENFVPFMREWFQHHFKTMDQKYVENFRKCGLK